MGSLWIGAGSAAVEVVGLASDHFAGIAEHRSAGFEIIPGPVDILPAGYHRAAALEIVPHVVDLLPPGLHHAFWVKVIPFVRYFFPPVLYLIALL